MFPSVVKLKMYVYTVYIYIYMMCVHYIQIFWMHMTALYKQNTNIYIVIHWKSQCLWHHWEMDGEEDFSLYDLN